MTSLCFEHSQRKIASEKPIVIFYKPKNNLLDLYLEPEITDGISQETFA